MHNPMRLHPNWGETEGVRSGRGGVPRELNWKSAADGFIHSRVHGIIINQQALKALHACTEDSRQGKHERR